MSYHQQEGFFVNRNEFLMLLIKRTEEVFPWKNIKRERERGRRRHSEDIPVGVSEYFIFRSFKCSSYI